MPQAALLWSGGGAEHEARLARAAAAGNGRAFATLYDRYEQRVFNLALRITGSGESATQVTREAFLDALRALAHIKDGEPFVSCLLTAARNAADELPGRGGGGLSQDASSGWPEPDAGDPELEAWQEQLREAALGLPAREREALALAGMENLSYAEIAAIVDTDRDSVPALLVRGRLALHDALCATTLAAAPPAGEACVQALPLIAMRDDGAFADAEDFAWLVDHLAHCAECRVRLDAVEEASARYREWQPVEPPPTLLRDVMAAAAGFAHADWDELIDELETRRSQGHTRRRARDSLAVTNPLPVLRPALTGASDAATEALGSLRSTASGLASDAWRRRPQRNRLATAGLLAVAVLGLSAIAAGATLVLRGGDDRSPAVPSAAPAGTAARPHEGRTFPTGQEPRPTERTARTKKRKPRRKKVAPAVVVERPQPEKRPSPPKRRSVPQAVAVPLPKTTPSPPPSQPPTTTPPAQTTPELPQFQPTP